MSEDTMSLVQKWDIVSPALEKAGIDTSRITGLRRAQVIGLLEADEVIGADDETWQDWAQSYAEKHPSLAKPGLWRARHADAIIENWQSGVFEDPESESTADDLVAAGKYAVLSWYEGSSSVYPAGETIKDVLRVVYWLQYSSETPEYVEGYFDLDTGKLHGLYAGDTQLETVVILRFGDAEFSSSEATT